MIADYLCSYIYYSGKKYNNSCIRPEGCRFHCSWTDNLPYDATFSLRSTNCSNDLTKKVQRKRDLSNDSVLLYSSLQDFYCEFFFCLYDLPK